MKDLFQILFFFAALIVAILFIMTLTPAKVYWSTSEDRCVKIIKAGEELSCDELPEKYERIWVK